MYATKHWKWTFKKKKQFQCLIIDSRSIQRMSIACMLHPISLAISSENKDVNWGNIWLYTLYQFILLKVRYTETILLYEAIYSKLDLCTTHTFTTQTKCREYASRFINI